MGITCSDADFVGLDVTEAIAARNEDGSLPETSLLHLSSGSRLIDAGIDCRYPYQGMAPDLGCYESSFSSGVTTEEKEERDVRVVVDRSSVRVLGAEESVRMQLYSISGLCIADVHGDRLSTASVSTGRYIVREIGAQGQVIVTQKILVN